MTLRELIEKAQSDLAVYKDPDTSEVEARLDKILKAGEIGSIAADKLEYLGFHSGLLSIRTSYSVRGGDNDSHYEIPESVIDVADPIEAVKEWSGKKQVAKARSEVKEAERLLAFRRKQLDEALEKYPALASQDAQGVDRG